MRVAIFADVHGNLTALDAVLDDINRQAPDLTFFAGDLCVYGSQPLACVERLRSLEIPGVYGNTDAWISNAPLLSDYVALEEAARTAAAHNAVEWAWGQLRANDRAWLRTLPFHRRVSPTIFPTDDLLIVHANPSNVEDQILPSEDAQQAIYGEVRQSNAVLEPLLAGIAGGAIAFGHVHRPFIRSWQAVTLVNTGSVSLPVDGDPRARYALLTWAGGSAWEVEHRYVDYDVDREVALLADRRPPGWEIIQRNLQEARPLYRELDGGHAPSGA